ncbi:DUF4265 domain-containing protein [Archangium sp.]|uniref:DUF4265 domain-containing protein n=1 Tax=Archangium sp. TaxID=1872627 RepID=UPI002D62FC93|nr:DUF4265 domain-containing protein [Archangium sp.]HYO54095.1 DUF4265 domain-containing protein [Archangium sp.]
MTDSAPKSHVKIIIPLEQDEDGYPPAGAESLWAVQVGEGRFQVQNIPFFAPGIAWGDIISATPEEPGRESVLRYQQIVHRSGHSTLRVFIYDESEVPAVCTLLEQLGCDTERSHLPRLVAIDVPPEVSLEKVRKLLDPGRAQERWDYEEAYLAPGS